VRSDPELRSLIAYAGAAGAARVRIYGRLQEEIGRLLVRIRGSQP
jgi:hypothetical protein